MRLAPASVVNDLAVVAARDDARAIARCRQDHAVMYRHAPGFAVRLGEQQRLFGKHEDGGTAEEMRGNDRRRPRQRFACDRRRRLCQT